ncbi:hypothetical protein H5T52_04775 [Candidatus Bipolaricaulota bacterium]|nr:hypothetical protein [Candidatus Bipolaricaulota bacterium]
MIFVTHLADLRRGIKTSDLRRNLLRICAREPHTIHDLIHAPEFPGIEVSLFSLQSEINVTVELGECKKRGLLVPVGRVPDPIVPGGTTELVRTSLLAFLISPELAYAEPQAYEAYLAAWFALPEVRAALGEEAEGVHLLLWAFPELAHRAFYSAAGAPVADPYLQGDPRRVFGSFFIADLPMAPPDLGPRGLLKALRRAPLAEAWRSLKGQGSRIELPGLKGWVMEWALRRPRRTHHAPFKLDVAPLSGPELYPTRLRPAGLSAPQSSPIRSWLKVMPPRRHRASRQESASSGVTGSGTS